MKSTSQFDTLDELRKAFEQRIGRAIDQSSWQSLAGDWPRYLPYDNADLKDLLERAASKGVRTRRRPRPSTLLRRARSQSLDEDLDAARKGLWLGRKTKVPHIPRFGPLAVVIAISLSASDLLLLYEDTERRTKALAAIFAASAWWGIMVREVAWLCLMHGIPVQRAFEQLTGERWGLGRGKRPLAVLDAVPANAFGYAMEYLGQKTNERWRHGMRRARVRGFLEAFGWKPGAVPPLGGWDEARRAFNRLQPWRAAKYDSVAAFRVAARRAFDS